MAHSYYEKTVPTAPMLNKDSEIDNNLPSPNPDDETNHNIPTSNKLGKILLREDTVMTMGNFQGCVCGRGQFTCSVVKKQWSVLCWGRQSDRKYYCLLVLLSATFALSLLGTIFFCFTNTLHDVILSNMIIRNNSLAYSVWRRPNVQPLMKVHLFNYTNWERVRQGLDEKLKVEEVGPYTYSQQLERVNVKFDGHSVSFQERNEFQYLPEQTVGRHFDQVIVPNLPLLGVFSKAKSMNLNYYMFILPLITGASMSDHPDAFVKLPVHRFLWGYDDYIITFAKSLPWLTKMNFDKFGLLVTKNGTVSERFTINTGQTDMNKMNIIERVDGEDHLHFWNDRECNRIDGTDGTIFPPSMLNKNDTLHVYYPNLCRRLPFEFKHEVKIDDDIVLYRYGMPENVFDDPDNNRANQCYCELDSPKCPPRGVINVTACTMGAPAMISFPHFHLGDPKLRKDILGLRPNATLHETHMDIHPTLGVTLQGKSAMQINIQVRKPGYVGALSYLKEDLILPVAWIEFEVAELPPSLKSLVYHGTYSTRAAQLGLTVISIATLLLSSACLALLLFGRRKRPCVTIKKVANEVREATTDLGKSTDLKATDLRKTTDLKTDLGKVIDSDKITANAIDLAKDNTDLAQTTDVSKVKDLAKEKDLSEATDLAKPSYLKNLELKAKFLANAPDPPNGIIKNAGKGIYPSLGAKPLD